MTNEDVRDLEREADRTRRNLVGAAHQIAGYAMGTFEAGPERGLGESFRALYDAYKQATDEHRAAVRALLDATL